MTEDELDRLALELIRPQLDAWLRSLEQEAAAKKEQERAA